MYGRFPQHGSFAYANSVPENSAAPVDVGGPQTLDFVLIVDEIRDVDDRAAAVWLLDRQRELRLAFVRHADDVVPLAALVKDLNYGPDVHECALPVLVRTFQSPSPMGEMTGCYQPVATVAKRRMRPAARRSFET